MFRGFGGKPLIPPTRSPQSAYRTFKETITSGNTPLSTKLWVTYKLIPRYHRKNSQSRVILVLATDEKANIPNNKGRRSLGGG